MVIRLVFILFPFLLSAQAGMMTTDEFRGAESTFFAWDAGYNPSAYPVINPSDVVIFQPSSTGDRTYNHLPYLHEKDGNIYAIWDTHDYDEEGGGQFGSWSYSSNNGGAWATVDTIVPPQADNERRADVTTTRIVIPTGFVEVNDSLFAIFDINDRDFSGSNNIRYGVGLLAVWIDTAQDTLGTPVWFANADGTLTAPDSFAVGYPTYDFSTHLNSEIFSYWWSNPAGAPKSNFSINYETTLYARNTIFTSEDLKEPSATYDMDGNYFRVWGYTGNDPSLEGRKGIEFSRDGMDWSGPFVSDLPDWPGGVVTRVINTGDAIYFIGNWPASGVRNPLSIAKSTDGKNFTAGYEIIDDATGPDFSGEGKGQGPQLPHAIQLSNGQLLVIYDIAKEIIQVSRFDAP